MASVAPTTQASDIQMDYMKLLITQLQNQNPLEPLDNNEMASQLAQFSQLEQLETMNSSFAKVLANAERTYANSLIGKEVSFLAETEADSSGIRSAVVEQVYHEVDGQIFLVSGDYAIPLGDVVSVKNGLL
ncbi:MAG: flagellar hook assembly protein FlgD [Planctomycetota bacterium]|jgi:flagellar basal-body rod modification protein FlgD